MRDDGLPGPHWFAEMARGSGLIFFVLRVHPDVAYEFISDALPDLLGVSAAEALADASAVHDRVAPEHRGALAAALATEPGEQAFVELKWLHRGGRSLHSRCWMRAKRRPDGSVVLEGTVAEITELRETQTDLRNSEQRYRLLAENAWDVVWTMGLDGTITYVSDAVRRTRGLTPEEAMHQALAQIHPPESEARVGAYYAQLFAAIAAGDEPPEFRGEMEYYRRDGSVMTGELQVIPHIDDEGNVVEIIGVTRDISERKVFEAELTRLALTDPMTGVWNRRHGTERFDSAVAQALADDAPLSVLMVDVDLFKAINDTHGHQAGDRVLIEVAGRLRQAVRATDVIARWGGEEFVVLLRQCGIGDAKAVAEKLRASVAESPFGDLGTVTVSIGIAELHDGESLDELIGRADVALYQAKRSGRNTVCC